ncbi:PspA-associated protein PspAB [Methanothrix sp.]|uniref:PspA-associated protein PspAB n=1 Tax=Methanothrix sp. TaxID=90426 RepID=UPI003C72D4F9
MGFIDFLLGSTKLPQPKSERLFAIATARVTLEAKLGLRPTGNAAICIKPLESSTYDRTRAEIEDLLRLGSREAGTAYRLENDSYGYMWVVLTDPEFEDLVSGIHMVVRSLTDSGLGQQLLCAVYPFSNGSKVYWIFSFKLGAYYPFVPSKSGRERESALELRLRSVMAEELPIEKDVERWYPIWEMPL